MEGHMMFANLNQYEQPEFLENGPQFEIVTPEKKLVYDIFSVEQAGEGGAAFEYGYDLDQSVISKAAGCPKEKFYV